MSRSLSPLLVIVGPTAVGKSALGVRVAGELGGEVISADSMQVYRHFDIGTGKLSEEQRRGVRHHLVDLVSPHQRFSAADFVREADEVIAGLDEQGKLPVVVGGSGLYVRALLRGLFDAPTRDSAIRAKHARLHEQHGAPFLHRRLMEVDPDAAQTIHEHDFVRISRALEVWEQTGERVSKLRGEHRFAARRYAALWVGLRLPAAELRHRIEARVDSMMAAGWLEEVSQLRDAGYARSHPMGSLGYRQLNDHLQGALDLETALRETKRDTWRFSRRQRNWFEHESDLRWLDETPVKVGEDAWLHGWLPDRLAEVEQHARGAVRDSLGGQV